MINTDKYDLPNLDIAWCPGCGNYHILDTIKATLAELEIEPENSVWVTGIGQAAKIPQYFRTNYFNGLHGRALSPATAIKIANPELTVIAESGDGCSYGEGGNHFLHTLRRNPDITHIVHDNRIYGLTKGQGSPTTPKGMKTTIQTHGVFMEPFNPISVAVTLGASFVARAFSGHQEETRKILKAAIRHKGYALVDILHPCVTFNKLNTFKWYKDNTYYLADSHDVHNQQAALERANETEKLPLGIFFIRENTEVIDDTIASNLKDKTPLYRRTQKLDALKNLIHQKAEI